MRYFIHLSYNGINYRGWQRQINAPSVQETFEKRLFSLLKSKPVVWGCGRTDAMVHASQFFLHFDTDKNLPDELKAKLNMILPNDITVHDIVEVDSNAHAQFDATARTYDYFFHTYKDSFLSTRSAYYNIENLNTGAMKEACSIIINSSDFRSLCKTPDKHNNTICKIEDAQFFTNGNGRYRFNITANRFLKGMIRIIMGYMLDIGCGKLTPEGFNNIINERKPLSGVKLAYPQGLFLSKIEYPYLNIDTTGEFTDMLRCVEKRI